MKGLAEPAERPRSERTRAQRAWSGAKADRSRAAGAAEGDYTAGTRSVEPHACSTPVASARARRNVLACGSKAPTTGGATDERPWASHLLMPPRMSRNENVWNSGSGGNGMTGASRVRSNASRRSGHGSLGRARKLGGE